MLDLHGNSKKKEVSPDGSPDKNVFDIQQGVALIIAVRKGAESEKLAEVWHGDLWGSRKSKSWALGSQDLQNASASPITHDGEGYPFEVRDHIRQRLYREGFSLRLLFSANSVGMMSKRDHVAYAETAIEISERLKDFQSLNDNDLERKYGNLYESRDWSISKTRANIAKFGTGHVIEVLNFPFDVKFTYHTNNSRGFLAYPVFDVMRHMHRKNIALTNSRITKDDPTVLVSEHIISHKSVARYDGTYLAPLYIYPNESTDQADALAPTERTLNLDPKLYGEICERARIDPADQAGPEDDFRAATGDARPSEVKVFDYIYGVLHSPDYRETFAEFLKIDFPRIPYPPNSEVFRHVSEKGEALRRLHLMEGPAIGDAPFVYRGDGDDVVASGYPKFTPDPNGPAGRVHINPDQYFADVPELAWNFYIGGYQPAQKWLKDRKGRALHYSDLQHYQNIVKILSETDRIMREIELPLDAGP